MFPPLGCKPYGLRRAGSRIDSVPGTVHERLLVAHEQGDLEGLTTLYAQAADAADDLNALCFFLTHAYVCALDAGDSRADGLRARLVEYGREE